MKRKYYFAGVMVIAAAMIFWACDNNGTTTENIYNVTIGSLTNGSISANPEKGVEGTEITLTVTPATGYKLKAGTLKYGTTAINETTLKFNLPAADVTVTAEFETAGTINNEFIGSWVAEDWDNNAHSAFLFKDDGTFTFNGSYNGTYTVSPATITYLTSTGNIEIVSSALSITNFIDSVNGTYQKGGLLTLTDAPEINYRVYISGTPWTSSFTEDLMTGNATAAIKACIGRTPGASDIAQGTMAPIFWNGSNSGVYHVLIRQWNAIWKYKNDVTFEDGKNTTPIGFAAMNVMTYSGSQEDRFLLIKNVAGNTRVRIITENITPTTNFDTYFEDAGTLPNLVATGQGMYPVLRWESGANLNNTYNVMLGLLDETWNNIVQVKYQNGVRFENGFGEVDWNTMIGKKYVAELFRGDYSHDDGSLSLTESDVAVNGTTYSGIYTEGGGTASTSGQTGTYTYFYLNEMKIGIGAFISGHGFQLAFGTAVTENISGIRGGWNPSPDIDISDFGTSPFNIFVYRN